MCCMALTACVTQMTISCAEQPSADLSHAEEFANDARFPFRFPLADMNQLMTVSIA